MGTIVLLAGGRPCPPAAHSSISLPALSLSSCRAQREPLSRSFPVPPGFTNPCPLPDFHGLQSPVLALAPCLWQCTAICHTCCHIPCPAPWVLRFTRVTPPRPWMSWLSHWLHPVLSLRDHRGPESGRSQREKATCLGNTGMDLDNQVRISGARLEDWMPMTKSVSLIKCERCEGSPLF